MARQQNLVTGNIVGEGAGGEIFSSQGQPTLSSNGPEPGIPSTPNAQLNGVVVIGASQNTIGATSTFPAARATRSAATSRSACTSAAAISRATSTRSRSNNAVSGNTIRSDGIYGVLLYDAPNNPVRPFTSLSRMLVTNRFGGQEINFRNYQAGFDAGTSLPTKGTSPSITPRSVHGRASAEGGCMSEPTASLETARDRVADVLHRARPRVPALFESKAKR